MNITDPINQILKHVPNSQAGIKLLTHDRNKQLVMEGGCFHFLDRSKKGPNGEPGRLIPQTGLTRVIAEFYWPNRTAWYNNQSSAAKHLRRIYNSHKTITKKKMQHRRRLKALDAQQAAVSHVRGSIVHRQVSNWFHMTPTQFAAHNPSGEHTQTGLIFEALDNASQIIIATEYKVACTEIGLASAIDIVSMDARTGKLRFIEVKTVPSRINALLFSVDNPSVEFSGLLNRSGLERTLRSHAKVQLGLCVLMLVEGMHFVHDFDSAILLVWDDGYEWIDVDAGFYRDYAGPIYQDLKNNVPGWKQQQRELAAEKKQRRNTQRKIKMVPETFDSFDADSEDGDD